ncbi:hypothetical protein ACTFIW_002794 [Dictyostelium discoideum]
MVKNSEHLPWFLGGDSATDAASSAGAASATEATFATGATSATEATSATDPIATTNTTGITSSGPTTNGRSRPYISTPPNRCYDCGRTRSPYWRKGTYNRQVVHLCNACGLNHIKIAKKSSIIYFHYGSDAHSQVVIVSINNVAISAKYASLTDCGIVELQVVGLKRFPKETTLPKSSRVVQISIISSIHVDCKCNKGGETNIEETMTKHEDDKMTIRKDDKKKKEENKVKYDEEDCASD